MKLPLVFLALATLVLGACAPPVTAYVPTRAQIAAEAGRVINPQEIVVLTDSAVRMQQLVTGAAPLGYGPVSTVEASPLGLSVRVLSIPQGRTGPEAIAELEALTPGVIAGINHAYDARDEAKAPTGRLYANALLRWPEGGCAARRPIGIVDAASAAPNAPYVVAHRSFARGWSTDSPHGWQVADLIADPARLSAPSVYIADVVGADLLGREVASVDAIVGALAWLRSEGVTLVNISLAGPYNKILDAAFKQAGRQGMTIVAAAGNEGPQSPPRFPAAFPDVIAVTAVDAAGRPYSAATGGDHVEIAAPGVDVFLGDAYRSGTSFAAGFVTAFLATRAASDVASARRLLSQTQRADLGGAPLPVGILDLRGGCR